MKDIRDLSPDSLFVSEQNDINFRRIFIEESGFRLFEIYCAECGERLVQVGDLTESDLKNEALTLYLINEHVRRTGHTTINGDIEPSAALQHIDVTITVNDY